MKRIRGWMQSVFQFSIRDCAVTLLCLLLASGLCFLLQVISDSDAHVPLIFVLAVLVVSRFTDGYILGFISSVFAVLAVNYVFTYPYFKLNFSLTGYPLTFVCFFGVSLTTCALTSRVRAGEKARMVGEREKMRANLLRAISHDLRTPLTSIVGALNAVTENDALLSAKERTELLTDAKKDAEWLINMVENLLSITRMESDGTPRLHKEIQVVEEVMSEAVSRFRKQYPNLKVEIQVPDEILFVPMDAMLIEQVIMNLLINVEIHGKNASRAILSAQKQKDYVVIRVEDNGCGIDSGTMQHLFDGQTGAQPSGGSGDSVRTMGIGLSVCKTIIMAHGGTMTARNRNEGGAILTFALPIKEADYGTKT